MDFLQQQNLDDLFFEADALIKEKKFTEAIATLEAILVEAPEYGKAYNHLGWIYETQYRDYAKAEDFYRKCMVYTPEYTPVYMNLSINLSNMAKYDEQEKVLQQALNVPGIDRAGINNEIAIMWEMRGNYSQAIALYKEAIRYSLVDANVEMYAGSIQRCKRKMELLQ
jgi:tetratricopeptide (TPR) repeat protein